MYSFEQKEQVIQELKRGISIDEIYVKYNISKSTISNWKKEVQIRKEIKQLIAEKELDKAEKLALDKLVSKTSEKIKLSILARNCKEKRR